MGGVGGGSGRSLARVGGAVRKIERDEFILALRVEKGEKGGVSRGRGEKSGTGEDRNRCR